MSHSEKILDSFFYEADVAYRLKSKEEHKQGVATDRAFLVMLSTDKENKYPKFLN